MTNKTLAQSYRIKAEKRLKILGVLLQEEAFSDVVREAQEIVELALKGVLRQVGVEPPKWHDVGSMLRILRSPSPRMQGASGSPGRYLELVEEGTGIFLLRRHRFHTYRGVRPG